MHIESVLQQSEGLNSDLNSIDNERYNMTIIITIIIHIIKTNNEELQLQKQLISTNGRPLVELIGQQHHLVGKWPMADRYIVLCNRAGIKLQLICRFTS